MLFQHLWDSENDISTSVLLSVVMPVHLVYAGTMVGAACACVDQDPRIVIFESLTFERSFQPTFYLSDVVW